MVIGLCNRMEPGWLDEFRQACVTLDLEYRIIAIAADDWMEQLLGVDVFVWRLVMNNVSCMAEARTKIPLAEAMGIRCFPNEKMLWLYDDKIRESFFLRRNAYPTPKTWIFFDARGALDFAAGAAFPLVVKSHCGASSSGVGILKSLPETSTFVGRVFRHPSLWDRFVRKYYYGPRLAQGDLLLALRYRYRDAIPRYAYFQEFIETDRDWRVTTLGRNLVSVFARKNRPGDFRASGSGIWQKITEQEVPAKACDLALQISNAHGFTSMTYDFMRHRGDWVIGEMSYAFLLNPVYTETLFQRDQESYKSIGSIPIGVMHLRAVIEAVGNYLPEGCAVEQTNQSIPDAA